MNTREDREKAVTKVIEPQQSKSAQKNMLPIKLPSNQTQLEYASHMVQPVGPYSHTIRQEKSHSPQVRLRNIHSPKIVQQQEVKR